MRRSARFLLVVALLADAACTQSSGEEPGNGDRPRSGEVERNRCEGIAEMVRFVRRGYYPYRSTDISWIPREPNYVGTASMPVHSGPWDYLMNVPIVIHGPGHVEPLGRIDSPATVADMAPTAARLIGFDEWKARDGRPLTEGLTGSAKPPALVVQIVWDGGGWNVLREHLGSWPFVRKLMENSVTYTEATVGASPSVTPPVHSTLGTGAWPARHGVAGLTIRTEGTYDYPNPFGGLRTDNLEITTLADDYDRARDNRPVTGMLGSVGWHLGMIGHGSGIEGGDQDPVALIDRHEGTVRTNPEIYKLPNIADPDAQLGFAEQVDVADGNRDNQWLGHPLETRGDIHYTPATPLFEEHILERLVTAEGFGSDEVPDLLYVNFKTSDVAGHTWGMTSDEVGGVVEYQDKAIRRFVRFLDDEVGRGRWVLMLTADHGQTPYPEESGAWPIAGGEIARDANRKFDTTDDGRNLIDKSTSAGAYVRLEDLKANGTTLQRIAKWLGGYTIGENLQEGAELPERFAGREDELLFDATMVRKRVAAVSCDRRS